MVLELYVEFIRLMGNAIQSKKFWLQKKKNIYIYLCVQSVGRVRYLYEPFVTEIWEQSLMMFGDEKEKGKRHGKSNWIVFL